MEDIASMVSRSRQTGVVLYWVLIVYTDYG